MALECLGTAVGEVSANLAGITHVESVELVEPIGNGLWGLGWGFRWGLSGVCTANMVWSVGVRVGLKWSLYSE